jgi:hypothetical protein
VNQTTHTSKSAVRVAAVLGKISTIIGWLYGLGFIYALIWGVSQTNNKVAYVICCLVFIAFNVLLIVHGKKTKDRIRRFRNYIAIIANQNETSIDQIATIVQMPVNFVLKDINFMIRKKYFVKAYIDQNTNNIVFQGRVASAAGNAIHEDPVPDNELQVVLCKSCGAQNKVAKGSVGECEYCGSPLSSK